MVAHIENGSGGEKTPLRIANVPVALIVRAYVTVLVPDHICEADKDQYVRTQASELVVASIKELAHNPRDFSFEHLQELLSRFTKLNPDFPVMVSDSPGSPIQYPGRA